MGWLLLCVVIALGGWFLLIPWISDTVQDGVSDGISTMIAEEVEPMYSPTQLRQGGDVRLSFSTINQELRTSSEDEVIDNMMITSSGDELIITATINDETYDVSFIPSVDSDGKLNLEPVDDGGWWQRQFTGVLSGGFERAINEWLDRNDLRLTDVNLEGDSLILSVTGK